MSPRIEHYPGREQSYIKHFFLNAYLTNAAYKLFQRRSAIFNFVDAFAGPWRISDPDEYSDASFSQAIDTLDAVRRALLNMGQTGLEVRFRFCERNLTSVAKLQQFAAQKLEFDIQVFSGSFEYNLNEIRSACRDGFTFTFIDPTGWNIESRRVFDFLRNLKGEFLFNFMSEEINRHAGWDGVARSVGRFLADPAWKAEFDALQGSNESRILQILKAKMKEARVATYLPEMAIRKPREDRIKMRLILGTNSASASTSSGPFKRRSKRRQFACVTTSRQKRAASPSFSRRTKSSLSSAIGRGSVAQRTCVAQPNFCCSM